MNKSFFFICEKAIVNLSNTEYIELKAEGVKFATTSGGFIEIQMTPEDAKKAFADISLAFNKAG